MSVHFYTYILYIHVSFIYIYIYYREKPKGLTGNWVEKTSFKKIQKLLEISERE